MVLVIKCEPKMKWLVISGAVICEITAIFHPRLRPKANSGDDEPASLVLDETRGQLMLIDAR